MIAALLLAVASFAVAQQQQCVTCSTLPAGRTSFFNGCNTCTCGPAGASCTRNFCAAVVPDPSSCTSQCDGFVTTDGCTCYSGLKTNCKKCGCDDTKATCERGLTCIDNKCQPLVLTPLPPGALDGAPMCVRTGGSCCGGGSSCLAGQVCDKNECVDASTCGSTGSDTCASNPCKFGEKCVPEKKFCITTPCPQYRCEKPTACAAKPCAADEFCEEDPKNCFTQPCPQFKCTKAKKCGCDDTKATCERGLTCVDNKCQPLILTPLPPGALDGAPMCVRTGGSCCGGGSSCLAGQVCDKNECVDPSRCSAPAGKCLTCATLPKGTTSFFDGCNTCRCSSSGGAPACTKRACAQVLPDPKSCKGRCDGSVTVDDAACGVCTCMAGKRTSCSKCNGTCQTSRSGKISCLAGIFNREDEEGVPDDVFDDVTPASSASVLGASFAVFTVVMAAF